MRALPLGQEEIETARDGRQKRDQGRHPETGLEERLLAILLAGYAPIRIRPAPCLIGREQGNGLRAPANIGTRCALAQSALGRVSLFGMSACHLL